MAPKSKEPTADFTYELGACLVPKYFAKKQYIPVTSNF
jgi:hypothetical protein